MADKVSVRRHVRKRTGRTAQVAASLGLPETVTVRDFSRRRPERRSWVPDWMGKWTEKMPGVWQREYATGVYADIVGMAADGMQVYEVSVVYDRPKRFEHILETTTGDSLSDAKKLADDAFSKWYLRRELKARSEHGLLFTRETFGSGSDTDDLLLSDLNVPAEMRPELKKYMETLKRTATPARER